MATVTNTIAQTGGDYTSIQAWENATNLNSNADIWKGVISDNNAYDEAVAVDQDGASDSSYVWLDVDSSNRHSGQPGTGHARLAPDTASGHAITCTANRFRVSGLEIKLESPGTSDEGLRFSNADRVLIEQCILWTTSTTSDCDGVFTNDDGHCTIINSLIFGFPRGCCTTQLSNATARFEIVGSTLLKAGQSGESEGAAYNVDHTSTMTAISNIVLYNSIFGNKSTSSASYSLNESHDEENINVSGSNVACLDAPFTGYDIYDGCSTNSLESIATGDNFTSYGSTTAAAATDDFTVKDASADIYQAGLAVGSISLTDTRGDLTVDIIGTARKGTPDIGAFELEAAGNPHYYYAQL